MAAKATELGAVGVRLLEAFRAELEALGCIIPARQLVALGPEPAWDSEQLTVALSSVAQGVPGGEVATSEYPQATILAATATVALVRGVPSLQDGPNAAQMTPDDAEQEQAAVQGLNDAGQLALAAVRVHQSYAITDPGEGFAVGPVTLLEPSGGLAGCRCQIAIQLS